MKAIPVAILMITSFFMSAQNVGFVRNAQYRITLNLDPVKKDWEQKLQQNQIDAVLTNFDIRSSVDSGNQSTVYFLVGTNKSRTVKVARLLTLTAGNLKFLPLTTDPGILICSGCHVGCEPSASYGKPECGNGCGDEAACVTVID